MPLQKKILRLVDKDIGLFLSYELSAEVLTTKLFHVFTLNSIPLSQIEDLREAIETDVTPFNWLNWLKPQSTRQSVWPLYTLQATNGSPRIFMRLVRGSHIDMKRTLGRIK
jgi:hypothetical protein